MPLLDLVVILIVVGVLLWLVNTYIPMQPQIKTIINAVVIICIVVWLLKLFLGGFGSISSIRVGR